MHAGQRISQGGWSLASGVGTGNKLAESNCPSLGRGRRGLVLKILCVYQAPPFFCPAASATLLVQFRASVCAFHCFFLSANAVIWKIQGRLLARPLASGGNHFAGAKPFIRPQARRGSNCRPRWGTIPRCVESPVVRAIEERTGKFRTVAPLKKRRGNIRMQRRCY